MAEDARRTSSAATSGRAETTRVEAFSDGVFAIVITLLVLELKPPHVTGGSAALWAALAGLLPVFLSWVVSLVFVLVIWINHHYLLNQLRHTDRALPWLNVLLLLGISFVPFPTALAGEYFLGSPGLFLLSSAMFVISLSFTAMRWYAGFVAELTHARVDVQALRLGLRRSLAGPVLYALAMALAFAWPTGALAIQIAVPVLFAMRSPALPARTPGL
jgi:uncharacterized membrane protein